MAAVSTEYVAHLEERKETYHDQWMLCETIARDLAEALAETLRETHNGMSIERRRAALAAYQDGTTSTCA